MFCAEQTRTNSNEANMIEGEEMEIFSIPGRLIIPGECICQCSGTHARPIASSVYRATPQQDPSEEVIEVEAA
jgi:hypothetical protein